MQINRDQFLEDGYLVLRQVIPPDQLDNLRVSYERLVKQQKVIWAEERSPNAPLGGVWETSAQPRLLLQQRPLADLIDRYTASAIEIWLHPNTQGVSSKLLDIPDAAVTEMMLMCSPVSDRGQQSGTEIYTPLILLHFKVTLTILLKLVPATYNGTSHFTTTASCGLFLAATFASTPVGKTSNYWLTHVFRFRMEFRLI